MTDNLNFFINYNNDEIRESILQKYENFCNFNMIDKPYIQIKNDTSSILNKLIYRKGGERFTPDQTFDAVLKVTVNRREGYEKKTNLFYEYFLGRAINKLRKYFPNFINTFAYINFKDEFPFSIKNDLNYDLKNISNLINTDNFSQSNIENGCIKNENSAIIIEYVPNSITIIELFKLDDYIKNFNYNIFTLLFQVYATLYALKETFCHADLHLENVMLVDLKKEIKIIYTIDGKEYIIFTRYIAVIIDYYSCVIKDFEQFDSSKYIEVACKTKCNTHNSLKRELEFKNSCYNDIGRIMYESKYNTPENIEQRKIEKCYTNTYFLNSLDSKESHKKLNKTNDIFFINCLIYGYDIDKNIHNYPNIPKNYSLKIKFKEIFNENTSPEWFRENSFINNYYVIRHVNEHISKKKFELKEEEKEFYCSVDCEQKEYKTPKYTSDVLLHFLIPYYNDAANELIKNKSGEEKFDTLEINCDKFEPYKYKQYVEPIQSKGQSKAFYEKYIKYKNKYVNLKNNLSSMTH